jgi:hypothetical protein
MDFVVANPAWLAIICFGVVSIISGVMLTGRDLDPIERVLPSISGIQKWCGIGILMAAIFVFLASPLTGKHLWEAEQRAVNATGQAATAALASSIAATVVEEVNEIADDGSAQLEEGIEQAIDGAITASAGAGYLAGADATEIATNSAYVAAAVGTALEPVLELIAMDEATEAQLEAGIAEGIAADMANHYSASPGAITSKANVTFYNPLSTIWGTMLGVFAIMVLVFSQITGKFGDQKPLSTMLIVLWPIIVAMCFYTFRLQQEGTGDVPGVMLDVFIMLIFSAIAIPLAILGMREKPREAGEYAGYLFILLGIDAIYIGIKYLWLFEVKPFVGMTM